MKERKSNSMSQYDGVICVENVEFPFHYQNRKVIIYAEKDSPTILDGKQILLAKQYGKISGGNILFHVESPISVGTPSMEIENGKPKNVAIIPGKYHFNVDWYILDYYCESVYNKMQFSFPEMEAFLPSGGILFELTDTDFTFSRKCETVSSFPVTCHGRQVEFSFLAHAEAAHTKFSAEAKTVATLQLTFAPTDDFDFIISLFKIVYSFFVFICNRRNISLHTAELYSLYRRKESDFKKEENGYLAHKIPSIFVLEDKYREPDESIRQIEKTINIRYVLSHLPELVSLITDNVNTENGGVSIQSIHRSCAFRNLIDLHQSLHITSAFEFYIRTYLPQMSSDDTVEVYREIKEVLNKYISGLEGKKKKIAKKIHDRISPDISLDQKIVKVYNGYNKWESLKPILSDTYGDDIGKLANNAREWRNELAHEKRSYEPTIETVRAIRLVEHINYCIVLRKANYCDSEIKAIIEQILVK